MASYLTFLRDRCKGCGLCISVCPKKILDFDNAANVKGYKPVMCTDIAACIGCASCAKICPDSIITVEKDD